MPWYDYECPQCGTTLTRRCGVEDRNRQACTACGARLQRLFTPPAIAFKGGGWTPKFHGDPR